MATFSGAMPMPVSAISILSVSSSFADVRRMICPPAGSAFVRPTRPPAEDAKRPHLCPPPTMTQGRGAAGAGTRAGPADRDTQADESPVPLTAELLRQAAALESYAGRPADFVAAGLLPKEPGCCRPGCPSSAG